MDNFTWYEVQERVRRAQREDPITIYKQDLSELDIYHRILRFKNYMVAMVNKGLLPVKIHIPLVGDVVFLTQGLKYNLEMILFCMCIECVCCGLFVVRCFVCRGSMVSISGQLARERGLQAGEQEKRTRRPSFQAHLVDCARQSFSLSAYLTLANIIRIF